MATAAPKTATIFRMVMPTHTCPYGLKAKDLLRREGFNVEDHWLRTREETDAFKAKHGVKTTPQTFIAGERVGGMTICAAFSEMRCAIPRPSPTAR